MNVPAIKHEMRGELSFDAPMASLTSWRTGGRADRLYRPADLADLRNFLSSLPSDEPVLWLGLGSNLLVRDGGLRGTVIATHARLNGVCRIGEVRVQVGAGVPCAKLARFAAREGLVGASFFAGIPGTLGGALAMNAGAFGGETWSLVKRVDILNRRGELIVLDRADFEVSYRLVKSRITDDCWFVAAELDLIPGGEPPALKNEIRQLLSRRTASQPTGMASCGSVFRNPPGDYAGRLIEAAGLKGMTRGGAQVSRQHGNFIINTGMASASEIEDLILEIQSRVAAHSGVHLEPEVHIVGERGDGYGH